MGLPVVGRWVNPAQPGFPGRTIETTDQASLLDGPSKTVERSMLDEFFNALGRWWAAEHECEPASPLLRRRPLGRRDSGFGPAQPSSTAAHGGSTTDAASLRRRGREGARARAALFVHETTRNPNRLAAACAGPPGGNRRVPQKSTENASAIHLSILRATSYEPPQAPQLNPVPPAWPQSVRPRRAAEQTVRPASASSVRGPELPTDFLPLAPPHRWTNPPARGVIWAR